MKTAKKALGLMLVAVLLVTATIFGTMAYLTDKDEVTNTFTVGSVDISLDEAPVGADGKAITGERVQKNDYKLMPGHEYDKDPIVHFADKSEASWLFIEVTNEIAGIESTAKGYKSIATQITENGWKALVDENNDGIADNGVYYQKVGANNSGNAVDYKVFQGFTVDGSVNGTTLANYNNKTVKVTAYAVQADGFTTASAAWTTGLGK